MGSSAFTKNTSSRSFEAFLQESGKEVISFAVSFLLEENGSMLLVKIESSIASIH